MFTKQLDGVKRFAGPPTTGDRNGMAMDLLVITISIPRRNSGGTAAVSLISSGA